MKKNLRNGVRFLKIFLGDTNHDEALSNSDSIRKNLDGNDAEKLSIPYLNDELNATPTVIGCWLRSIKVPRKAGDTH